MDEFRVAAVLIY